LSGVIFETPSIYLDVERVCWTKIFFTSHFFRGKTVGLHGKILPSTYFHVEKGLCTKKFSLFVHFQQNAQKRPTGLM